MKKYYLPRCPSEEEWEKMDLELYNTDKKEWLAVIGYDPSFSTSATILMQNNEGVVVDISQNDSYEVTAMKIRNAIDGKEFIEAEHTRSGQKKLT